MAIKANHFKVAIEGDQVVIPGMGHRITREEAQDLCLSLKQALDPATPAPAPLEASSAAAAPVEASPAAAAPVSKRKARHRAKALRAPTARPAANDRKRAAAGDVD